MAGLVKATYIMTFNHYKRKGVSEMISVTEFTKNGGDLSKVSLSSPDHLLQTHNPDLFNLGYVARNPKNHEDIWYVSKEYHDENLEPIGTSNGSLTFGQATEAAKNGKRVARTGWNGSGMFAYIVPAASYPAQTEAAKKYFGENAMVPYRAYWALKTAQEDVATWTPSGSDTLAEDWVILE